MADDERPSLGEQVITWIEAEGRVPKAVLVHAVLPGGLSAVDASRGLPA